MALQNNIIAGPNPDITYAAYTDSNRNFEWKFTVTQADIAALGAFTTGDVILCKIPSRAFITHTFTKHSTAVAGPSISACTAQVQTATGNRGGVQNVFTAPGNTTADYDLFLNVTATAEEPLGAVVPVFLHLIATGANLSVATAGQIDVVVGYRCLPV
jgi:hypothetical protein